MRSPLSGKEGGTETIYDELTTATIACSLHAAGGKEVVKTRSEVEPRKKRGVRERHFKNLCLFFFILL